MSAEQLTAMIEAARADESVAARLAEATTTEQGVAVAAELGFHITVEDLDQADAAGHNSGELSEHDLPSVAGGTMVPGQPPMTLGWRRCY